MAKKIKQKGMKSKRKTKAFIFHLECHMTFYKRLLQSPLPSPAQTNIDDRKYMVAWRSTW